MKTYEVQTKFIYGFENVWHDENGKLEYFDTREYSPGDDFRNIAWNTYARSDKLYYNQLIDESNIKISILLDSSKSMRLGNPQKLLSAKNIVLLLSKIANANHNQIEFYSFSKILTKYQNS